MGVSWIACLLFWNGFHFVDNGGDTSFDRKDIRNEDFHIFECEQHS
jgi:hypothetical protein